MHTPNHLLSFLALWCLVTSPLYAQGGPRPTDLGSADLPVGEPGIAWHTTWSSAWHEAQRSNRSIMFVAAATQCGGVPGVF